MFNFTEEKELTALSVLKTVALVAWVCVAAKIMLVFLNLVF
jgi:hypothetical protein